MLLRAYLIILPIAISSALMAMANGFLASFLPTRISLNDIDPARASDFVAAYAAGMLISCIFSAQIIRRVGHIRAFCVFSCLSGICCLLLSIFESYYPWILLRFINGYCGVAVFLVAQSWLNDQTESQYRGQILTVFYVIYLLGIGFGAFSVSFLETESSRPFIFAALIYMLAVMPVSLTKLPPPPAPEVIEVRLRKLWKTSPVGFLGCFISGATAMTMQGMGSVLGTEIGLSITQIGLMMALAQLGGLMQYPLGYLSDKIDRRYVIFGCACAMTVGGVFMGGLSAENFLITVAIVTLFIGLGETMLSLALANANDRADVDEYASIAGTTTLVWCLGAILGPIVGSLTMETTGPLGISIFFVISVAAFAVFTLFRCLKREAAAEEDQVEFTAAPLEWATSEAYSTEENWVRDDDDDSTKTS